MAVKQTAGRDQLGDFAPEFAHLNDDMTRYAVPIDRTGAILQCHVRTAVPQ